MATTITGTTIDVGPNKLVANSAGNVGIGTASPAKPLDVTGDIRTSTGILFGTDTAAANTLSDYETGTWSPTFPNVNPATGGTYVKIGSYVYCTCFLNCQGSGGTQISGLPFTPLTGSTGRGTGSVGYQNRNSTESWQVIVSNTSNAFSMYVGAGAIALANGNSVYASFSYRTTA